MRLFESFWRNQSGSFVSRMANVSLVVAIVAVALVSVLDRATRDGGAAIMAFFHPESAAGQRVPVETANRGPGAGGIDPTPTGSISPAVVLDPCTGRQK
jgi:Flp pilus assembly pilin Flp